MSMPCCGKILAAQKFPHSQLGYLTFGLVISSTNRLLEGMDHIKEAVGKDAEL